jgi:hypothetical protein
LTTTTLVDSSLRFALNITLKEKANGELLASDNPESTKTNLPPFNCIVSLSLSLTLSSRLLYFYFEKDARGEFRWQLPSFEADFVLPSIPLLLFQCHLCAIPFSAVPVLFAGMFCSSKIRDCFVEKGKERKRRWTHSKYVNPLTNLSSFSAAEETTVHRPLLYSRQEAKIWIRKKGAKLSIHYIMTDTQVRYFIRSIVTGLKCKNAPRTSVVSCFQNEQ